MVVEAEVRTDEKRAYRRREVRRAKKVFQSSWDGEDVWEEGGDGEGVVGEVEVVESGRIAGAAVPGVRDGALRRWVERREALERVLGELCEG